MTDPIPPSVRRLLRRQLTSVSQLEALLTLVNDRRWWSTQELATHMVLKTDHIAILAGDLAKAKLVAIDGDRCRFEPASADTEGAVLELAALYDRYRLRILNIMFSSPTEQARDFADAFRLRRTDEHTEEE